MSWVRTSWLIVLTLIATTLPSSAFGVQLRPERDPQPISAEPPPAPTSNNDSPISPEETPAEPAKLKIAPNTELWDGGGRTLSVGATLASICITGHPGGPNLAPEERPSFPPVDEITYHRSSQRAWLSDHYPHAPPV